MARVLPYFLVVAICITLAVTLASGVQQPQNQPPVVKIIKPAGNAAVSGNAPVAYEITVADKEDGNSKYDEINAKEVVLKVRYVGDKSDIAALLKNRPPDAPGLAAIEASNCFNCHNFNTKAMGPSFFEIAKKYPATASNVDTLAKRVTRGSSGAWGNDKMPGHPELSTAESKLIIEWILKHGHDTGTTYITGLQGQFLPLQLMPFSKTGGGFILTACYTDHGLKNVPGSARLKGADAIAVFLQ
jgi:cytochrome c